MHRKIIYSALFLTLTLSLYVAASSSGKIGRTNLSSTPGCTCHGSNPSGNVQIIIDGPDTVDINSTNTYQVRISGGPAVSAGTNIAASDGSLAPVSSTLKLDSGQLTHTSPVSFAGHMEVVFEFDFTAPATIGQVTLAANGNSVNLNGSNSGDEWDFAPNKIISVEIATAITDKISPTPEVFVLNQNYPNPFNPNTRIKYQVFRQAHITLSIFNALGQIVHTLVDQQQAAGTYMVDFRANDLPSGSYFYSLKVGSDIQTKRMILKK